MRFQNSDENVIQILARIGIDEKDYTNSKIIARALRSLVVDEWLGEHSDHYQNAEKLIVLEGWVQ